MSFVEHFKKTYYDKLITPTGGNPVRNRADGFLKLFDAFYEYKTGEIAIVLETGTMRADHGELNFSGDGCSTIIFDDFVNSCGKYSRFTSVDISQENCNYSKKYISETGKTKIICSDSVKYIWGNSGKIDILYLDSYDILRHDPIPSQLHHLKELAAALKNLDNYSLVMVDDHQAFFDNIGKGDFVKSFMLDIGAEILYEGYQVLFRMK